MDINLGNELAEDEQVASDAEGASGNAELADGGDAPAESTDAVVNLTSDNAMVEIVSAEGEPEVTVAESGEPLLAYETAEPEVTVIMTEQPTVEIQQTGEATLVLETVEERELRLQEQGEQQPSEVAEDPSADGGLTVGELLVMTILTENGDDLGAPEAIVEVDGAPHMVLSSGGFLGLAESRIAVPMSRITMQDGGLVVQSLTESEIENADNFEFDSNAELAEDQQISINGG